jgi:hypothetical protein
MFIFWLIVFAITTTLFDMFILELKSWRIYGASIFWAILFTIIWYITC